MPRFQTPAPISLELELGVADVRIEAGDRVDTVVDVRPGDPSKRDDVAAADRTQIEHSPGRLLVKTPKSWRTFSPFGYGGAVEVHIELPAGSRVIAKSGVGSIRSSGELGESQVKTGLGDIHIQRAAAARLTTGMGDVEVGQVSGPAELNTGSGDIRAGELHGAAVLKNANGDVRVAAAVRGSVEARTGYGQIEVGVPDGTAAWLDLQTGYGQVHNRLDRSGPPESGEESVEVRAHSGYGDITLNRAPKREPTMKSGHHLTNGD
jgi:Putative adhesin